MSKALTWPNFSGERRTIPGVPSPKDGWAPGVKLPLSEIGISEADAAERIKGTPLRLVDLKDPKTTKGGGD